MRYKIILILIALCLISFCTTKNKKSIIRLPENDDKNAGLSLDTSNSVLVDTMIVLENSVETSNNAELIVESAPKPIIIPNSDNFYYERVVKTKNKEIKDVTNDNAIYTTTAKNGRFIYYIPERMKYRNTYKVYLRITRSLRTVTIISNTNDTLHSAIIPSTPLMEVKLIDTSPTDDRSFDIVSNNEGTQFVDTGDTYTEWSWSVTPIRITDAKLQIVISIIRDGNKKESVYQKNVNIDVDYMELVRYFIMKYWQFIASSVVIPLVVFLYKRRRNNNNE